MANGYILYEGPSEIDGEDIVVIATGINTSSKNSKTGGMIQIYILCQAEEPHVAIANGNDYTICGDCIHRGDDERGRSCYVQFGQGPLQVYRAWKRGNYPVITSHSDVFAQRKVRFGAYGDPAAAPAHVWEAVANHSASNTGYTHQWKTCDSDFAKWCMASADSTIEAREAQALGYRTFRVGVPGHPFANSKVNRKEALCPASELAGKLLQCHECLACGGVDGPGKGNIFIPAHGNKAHMSNVKKIPIAIAA